MYILFGLSLGISAGLTPGPLNALVVSTTIQYGWLSGLRVTLAPLITDLPIIILAVFFVNAVPESFSLILQGLGGGYLIFLAWRGLQSPTSHNLPEFGSKAPRAGKDLLRGAITNLTNPSPYVFWTSVGAPIIISGFRVSLLGALGFLIAFYGIFIALLISQVFVVAYLLRRKEVARTVLNSKRVAPALLGIVGVILIVRSVLGLV